MKSLESSRINVMVRSVSDAVNFYNKTLGLDLIMQYGEHYAEIQAAELILGIHPKKDNTEYGNNLSIGFGVTEFEEEVRILNEKGLNLEIEQDGYIRLAHFQDPDGNALYLAERKS